MTTYPAQWIIGKPFDPVNGRILPLEVERWSGDICENCGMPPPGILFGWHIGEGNARLYIDRKGKFVFGKTVQAPCPVCGGSLSEYLRASSGLVGRQLDGKGFTIVTIDTFKQKPENSEALAGVKSFVAGATDGGEKIPWLFISGSNGTGKTHLMWAAINMLIACGRTGCYITLKKMLDDLRDSFDEYSSEQTAKIRTHYIGIQNLFIDEFEKDSWTDWGTNEAFEILNERGLQGKPTMICSNKSLQELECDKFRALISRFQTGIVANILGTDMRREINDWTR
jgi:hypothetical protein